MESKEFRQSNPRHDGRNALGFNEKSSDSRHESNMYISLGFKGVYGIVYVRRGIEERVCNQVEPFPITLNFPQSKSSDLIEPFVDSVE